MVAWIADGDRFGETTDRLGIRTKVGGSVVLSQLGRIGDPCKHALFEFVHNVVQDGVLSKELMSCMQNMPTLRDAI